MSLIWVDTETNGLLNWARLLEVAVVITDEDLNITSEASYVMKQDRSVAELMAVSDAYVRNMHTKNGLWQELLNAELTYEQVEFSLINMAYEAGIDPNTTPMCGSTIGFDRKVLAKYLPNFESYCHYRSIDVSSVKELAKIWSTEIYAGRPTKDEDLKVHRALDDIRSSIEELRYYKDNFFVNVATTKQTLG